MQVLPDALSALAAWPQFIAYRLEPKPDGKTAKVPCHWQTGQNAGATDPAAWADFATIAASPYEVGFAFSEADPFFFLDIDNAWDGSRWSDRAQEMLSRFAGASVEVSGSLRGLHIIGAYLSVPPHGCRNGEAGLELYTADRFVALTGTHASGNAGLDCTASLEALCSEFFPAATVASHEGPVEGYAGPTDDDELIRIALGSGGAASAFGGKGSFETLWSADADALSEMYPDAERDYDASAADAALAQHLAFWTGSDAERIDRLMRRSALFRSKWEREDYLPRTIERAIGLQTTWYAVEVAADPTWPDLRAKSDKQRQFAETRRASLLAQASPEDSETLLKQTSAKFWLDCDDRPVAELAQSTRTNPTHAAPVAGAELVTGMQYLGATLQVEHFEGCVYVQDVHKVFVPSGDMLTRDQFKVVYGGFVFQMDDSGAKTTRDAWEAFTVSQCVRFPKASATLFRPDLEPGKVYAQDDGSLAVNVYVDPKVATVEGDIGPYLRHLELLLPDPSDRAIATAYMAACVQHAGYKFQWAPLFQGVEGNGKTLLTRCVANAVGRRYVHFPKAKQIDSQFNGWMRNTILIGVEDIYVPEHRSEVIEALKPMITGGDGLEIENKRENQITCEVCCNFILNSNHKDALRKTLNDRRFAIFYTAQQTASDLTRDGMTGRYFPDLYEWLRTGGYAAVSHYLTSYSIPDALNPATLCQRAPETTSTREAVTQTLGYVEQEVFEAVQEGRPGFRRGWISSIALDSLLQRLRGSRRIGRAKRKELLESLGYAWHPSLNRGRVNVAIPAEGGRPTLYVSAENKARFLTDPKQVVDAYVADQETPEDDEAVKAAFQNRAV